MAPKDDGQGNAGNGQGNAGGVFFNRCKIHFNQKVNDETSAWNLVKTWILSNIDRYHEQIETAAQEGETFVIVANIVKTGIEMYLDENPTISFDPSVEKMWIRKNELIMLEEFRQVFANEGFTAAIDRKKLILSGWDK